MSSDAELLPQRLHPLSLPFSFLAHVKGFALPLVVFLVVGSQNSRSSWELWAMVFIVPAMVVELWRYLSLRYWIEDDELIVRQGVVKKRERHVPLARIQTIDSTQNFLERIFNVVEVRVETAGSGEPEAHLKVLSLAARDELRRQVFAGRTAGASGEPADGAAAPPHQDPTFRPLHRVTPGELALLGLSPGRGLAILAGFIGLATQLDLMEDADYASLVDWASANLAGELLVDVLLVLALVVLVLLLSLVAVFVRLHDFRLERRGDEFRTECGLLTRHSTTIPARRIQFVSVQASPVLRALGKRLIKVRTAGARSAGDGAALTRQWLLPVVSSERVPELVRSIVPDCDWTGEDNIDWQPLASGAARRDLRKAWIGGSLITAIPAVAMALDADWGATALPWIATLFLVILPVHAWLAARAFAWAHTDWGLVTREGVLGRKFAFVPTSRVQTVGLGASPFDRRWRMAHVSVDTAGSNIGHRARIPYLERGQAEELAARLVRRAEASARA